MALKPCVECGREISTEAAACPHCGKTLPKASPASGCLGWGCFAVVAFVVLSTALGAAVSNSPSPPVIPTAQDAAAQKQAAEEEKKSREDSDKLVALLIKNGLVLELDCEMHEAVVDVSLWNQMPYNSKGGATMALSSHCEGKTGYHRMKIFDHMNHRELAGVEAFSGGFYVK